MYRLCDGACSANSQRLRDSCIISVMAPVVLIVRDDLPDSCIISVMAPVVLIGRDDLPDSCVISVMAPVVLIVRDDLIHVSSL